MSFADDNPRVIYASDINQDYRPGLASFLDSPTKPFNDQRPGYSTVLVGQGV